MSYKKSRAGGGDYYIACQTADDYYANAGAKEPPGEWFVAGSDPATRSAFGLQDASKFDGDAADKFKALVNGFHPETGEALTQNSGSKTRVAIHDFTFSAPKSVSVIWSQAGDNLRTQIAAAQRESARDALEFLSDKAGYTRRGKGGEVKEHVALMGALFEHGSSRENDPQLHTHGVILNLAVRADGTTGSIETKDLMSWQGAAASMYHAGLSRRLADLGFDIKVEGKMFELAGVPEAVCEAFSQRRQAIVAAAETKAAALGMTRDAALASRGLMQQATIETRDAKNELTREELLAQWSTRGAELGFGTAEVEALRHAVQSHDLDLDAPARAQLTDGMLDQITSQAAVFAEPTLYTLAATRMLGQGTRSDIEAAVRDIQPQLLTALGHDHEIRYTTAEMRLVEARMLELAGTVDKRHVIDSWRVEAAIAARLGMSDEQADAVRYAATDDRLCSVVQGSAGSGKTFSMQTVAQLYKEQGYELHGLATTWSAADTLRREAGLDNHRAIAGWLMDVESGKLSLNNKTVLIVDEAGLVGARETERILRAANDAGAKVILTGDEKQLVAIGAGDSLRSITAHCGGARIDTIRRQHDPVQRTAIKELYNGSAESALSVFKPTICDGAEATNKAVFDAWCDAKAARPESSVLMIALSNADVSSLNKLAREHLAASGRLGAEALRVAAIDSTKADPLIEFRVGDEVAFRTNNKFAAIYNRSHATITSIDADKHVMTLHTTDGRDVLVDTHDSAWYDQKREVLALQHAYAVTAYSSQGLTVDSTIVRDSTLMDRRTIAVAMSRHRDGAEVFVDRAEHYARMMERADRTAYTHASNVTDAQILESVAESWQRERYKSSTIDFERDKSGWDKSDGTRFDAAVELKLDSLRCAQTAIEQARSSSRGAAHELPFQARPEYALDVPKLDARDADRRRVELVAEHGIAPSAVLEAERQGVLHMSSQGPAFAGRSADGRVVNVVTEAEGREPEAAPGALRYRYPPILRGSDELIITQRGQDALAIWSQRDEAGQPRPTIIIADARPGALAGPEVREQLQRASSVTVHERAADRRYASTQIDHLRRGPDRGVAEKVAVRKHPEGQAPAEATKREAAATTQRAVQLAREQELQKQR